MPARPLPIDRLLPNILQALARSKNLVLEAPPGAGKTTRVPPALLDAPGLLGGQNASVVLLQPRRVAARASAARIAEERGGRLGDEVGFQVRFERAVGAKTRLRVVTEGVLTRQLVADPFLEGVGAVVLDEFHERSLSTDLALAMLREVQTSVREDLRIIVMSATLDPGPVSAFLGGCPTLKAEGRSYPVETTYLPPSTSRAHLADEVARAVEHALSLESEDADRGDVLVFLPGMEEIRRSARRLAPLADREGLLILPLHGSLPSEAQDRAIRPADQRKVILSTNVAETSLTIDGVRTVIDSGLARFASYDPARGLERLELGKISRASAAQRAGRAGRTGPGRCFRLWAEREDRGRAEFDPPEIERADLPSTVLVLKAWGQPDVRRFGWFQPPSETSVEAAERLLTRLGALESGRVTPLGLDMLAMPVHPRLARLLLAGHARLRDAAGLAALLSEKDILSSFRSDARGESDLLDRLDRLDEAERARFSPGLRDRGIDPSAARRVAQTRDDLMRRARSRNRADALDADDPDLLSKALLLAYPDRVCRRRLADPTAGLMVGGRGVRLDPASVVKEGEFFLALDARSDHRRGISEARVRIASAIEQHWLSEFFPESLSLQRVVRFDESRGRAIASRTMTYLDLVLAEDTHGAVDPDEASQTLADALSTRAEAFVNEDESAAVLLLRLAFLKRSMPEADWPDMGLERLAEAVSSACSGRRSVDEVRRVPLAPILMGYFSSSQQRALREHAPEALEVPSGNRIRLTYEPDRPPVLAVRLQELFGWSDTPRLAGGRVPVLLHLLGPNFRPVQVTDDLRSFWSSTYHQVRKDLRARYPKHSWPEDPWTARAEARGGRRS
jgi:ATP-dependent helicase HrpB